MARKRQHQYHHGDLSRALVQEAVRTIQKDGVEALTVRAVGQRLGVSRTALYRHFADKSALLAAVASEGFRTLRDHTREAWERHGTLEPMGRAYVQFALDHPSYYRVMFGGFVKGVPPDSDLVREGTAAFQVLVDAIVALQEKDVLRRDHPLELAQYIWATVHGISMLAIDGQLKQPIDKVVAFALERMRTSIAPSLKPKVD